MVTMCDDLGPEWWTSNLGWEPPPNTFEVVPVETDGQIWVHPIWIDQVLASWLDLFQLVG